MLMTLAVIHPRYSLSRFGGSIMNGGRISGYFPGGKISKIHGTSGSLTRSYIIIHLRHPAIDLNLLLH